MEFEGRVPVIAETAYVDEDAKVVGDVRKCEQCYIPGARSDDSINRKPE